MGAYGYLNSEILTGFQANTLQGAKGRQHGSNASERPMWSHSLAAQLCRRRDLHLPSPSYRKQQMLSRESEYSRTHDKEMFDSCYWSAPPTNEHSRTSCTPLLPAVWEVQPFE